MTTKIKALSIVLLFGAGCLGQPPTDEEIADSEVQLTRSPTTLQDSYVVRISAGSKGCTGTVLSPHWILAAAHCANVPQATLFSVSVPTPQGNRHLYDQKSAQYFPNPDYNTTCPAGVCIDTDADDDIGLIHLTGGAINLTDTGGVANLYDDDQEPYHGTGDRYFKIIGFGRGSDPNGTSDCDDASSLVKRVASGFKVDVSGDNYQGHAPYGDSHPCPGDSGGPWMFTRGPAGAEIDLQFGIMSSMRPDTIFTSPKMWSALVKPRFAWIEQTSAGTTDPLTCKQYSVGTFQYRHCNEPRRWVPPDVTVASIQAAF